MLKRKVFLKTWILLFAIFLAPVSMAESYSVLAKFVPNAEKVGQGRLTYLAWDVYDATLYAPNGEWQNGAPLALKLSYLRDIPGKKIVAHSIAEIRKQDAADEVTLNKWEANMLEIFPDVSKGIEITGIYTNEGHSVFYQNHTKLGEIKNPKFTKAFFNIWLDEETSSPDLRMAILGGS